MQNAFDHLYGNYLFCVSGAVGKVDTVIVHMTGLYEWMH